MGKILEYSNYGSYPREDDLIFFCDYNDDNANPTTKKLLISDLNKKLQIWAATSAGLKLTDDGGNYGIFIKDNGGSGLSNVGIGAAAASFLLDVQGDAVDTANVRIYSSTADSFPYLKMQNNATYWSIYAPHGNFTGTTDSDVADLFGIYNGSYRLVIQGNGNVGIGVQPSSDGTTKVEYPLQVSGAIAAKASYTVYLDPSTASLESSTSLHLQKTGTQDIVLMYFDTDGTTVNPALFVDATGKKVVVGSNTARAKFHVLDATSGTNVLIQDSTNGAVLELRRAAGASNSNSLYISNTTSGWGIGPATTSGATTVNIGGAGQLAVGNTTFAYQLAVTSSSNVVAQIISDDGGGSRLLIEDTTNQGSTQDSLVAFPISTSGGTRTVNWMCGYYRKSNVDYFAINHSSSTFSGSDSEIAFANVLTDNEMYMTTAGDTTFKGHIAATGIYDNGGTTVGNFARGRFLQSFSIPMVAGIAAPVFPALGSLYWGDDGNAPTSNGYSAAQAPDGRYASVAPHAGRLCGATASFFNVNTAGAINATGYFYSGGSLPTSTDNSGLSYENAAKIPFANVTATLGGTSSTQVIGFSSFTDTATSTLNFGQGDFLLFAIDTNSGNDVVANITLTYEFQTEDLT
jgi:hypothetical protein